MEKRRELYNNSREQEAAKPGFIKPYQYPSTANSLLAVLIKPLIKQKICNFKAFKIKDFKNTDCYNYCFVFES